MSRKHPSGAPALRNLFTAVRGGAEELDRNESVQGVCVSKVCESKSVSTRSLVHSWALVHLLREKMGLRPWVDDLECRSTEVEIRACGARR